MTSQGGGAEARHCQREAHPVQSRGREVGRKAAPVSEHGACRAQGMDVLDAVRVSGGGLGPLGVWVCPRGSVSTGPGSATTAKHPERPVASGDGLLAVRAEQQPLCARGGLCDLYPVFPVLSPTALLEHRTAKLLKN